MTDRFLLAPDSFKGTLSAQQVCGALRRELLQVYPEAEVVSIPMADGGEGSVDAFLTAVGGEKVTLSCRGPHEEDLTAFYGLLPDGTAVIEMAAAAGLPLVGDRLEPDTATTYGVGQLMANAADRGAKKLILCLGGSATNDGGCGAAAALGVRFLDEAGNAFVPTGGALDRIARIDPSGRRSLPETVVMCDIDNPLCGPAGASAVFGPQKGADASMIARLDGNLSHLAEVIRRDLGADIRDLPGAGAAGGMGGGAVAFFGGRLQMGAETVLDTVGFDALARGARLVITGEGRLDGQSVQGKVISAVARRSRAAGAPCIAVVGAVGDGADGIYDLGVDGVFTTNHAPEPFEKVRGHAEENLCRTARNLFRFLAAMDRADGKARP